MIVIAGNGKLAGELLHELPKRGCTEVVAWPPLASVRASVAVHAGSGRELDDVIAYCRNTGATLVELATGSALAGRGLGFPVVLCPNTNILMLKFLAMLAANGHYFRDCRIDISESHQADKTSVPGTAVALARALGRPSGEIRSIRDPRIQTEELRIPADALARHAYHRIEIADAVGSIVLETRIFDAAPYADGLARIIAAIRAHPLECRQYEVVEFIEHGWI